MYDLTIIGGGPSCVSAILQFLDKIEHHNKNNQRQFKVAIFAENKQIGPGLSYSTHCYQHILNLASKLMSPDPNDPQLFYRWLIANKTKYQDPCLLETEEDLMYPPRKLFGEFLEVIYDELKIKASRLNIVIDEFIERALKIEKTRQSTLLRVVSNSYEVLSKQVLLAIGHMENEHYRHFLGTPGYIHNPWTQNGINQKVIHADKVVIIGSRLTAIDMVLALTSKGYAGEIYMVSRSGMLPCVIGASVKYELQYITRSNINRLAKQYETNIPIDPILKLFWEEIENAEGRSVDQCDIFGREMDPISWLEKETFLAETTQRPWQSVLISLFLEVPYIWTHLSIAAKAEFFANYYSYWMTYLSAFPLKNARRLLTLFRQGRLKLYKQLRDIQYEERNQFYYIYCGKHNDECLSSQYLINAIGPGYNVNEQQSPLISSLLASGMIRSNKFGGVDVSEKTYNVVNNNGEIDTAIFVIGELTRGKFLATTDLSQVVKQISVAMDSILRALFEGDCTEGEHIPSTGVVNRHDTEMSRVETI